MRNFKKFLEHTLIQNDDWVTNGHFMIRKDALGKSENNFLDKSDHNEQADKFYNEIIKIREQQEYKTKDRQFIGRFIVEGSDYNVITEGNTKDDYIGLMQDYYEWFTKKGFTIHIIDIYDRLKPMGLYKNDEFVGILLPVLLSNRTELKYKPLEV